MILVVYRDERGEWRWHIHAANGRIVADSAEGYENRADCVEMATKIAAGGFAVEVRADG